MEMIGHETIGINENMVILGTFFQGMEEISIIAILPEKRMFVNETIKDMEYRIRI